VAIITTDLHPNPKSNSFRQMSQSARWCFTVNNYSDADVERIKSWEVRYLVFGYEVAPGTGTLHLQGFVVFKKNFRLAGVRKLGVNAHWEVTRGSNEQAASYCKGECEGKEPNAEVYETGEMPAARGESEKERWAAARSAAVAGNLADVPDDIFVRYYRTLKEIGKDNMTKPEDLDEVCGLWLYGPPGTGKSHKARADHPDAYLKMQNKWWDGYQGQEFVILDDFDSKELGHLLKIWVDKYSFLAETKGGAIHIRPKKFIITSNYHPSELWEDSAMQAAILRRFEIKQLLVKHARVAVAE